MEFPLGTQIKPASASGAVCLEVLKKMSDFSFEALQNDKMTSLCLPPCTLMNFKVGWPDESNDYDPVSLENFGETIKLS